MNLPRKFLRDVTLKLIKCNIFSDKEEMIRYGEIIVNLVIHCEQRGLTVDQATECVAAEIRQRKLLLQK